MEPSIKLNTGYSMPRIGLGTWDLRGNNCVRSAKFALENGYRHIDTATMYGNEAMVGKVVNDLVQESTISRDEIFITTKIWTSDLGVSKSQFAIIQSLENLNLDYIDLHLIHWPGSSKQTRLEAYGVLLKNKQQGKIRSIGVSNFSISQIEEVISEYSDIPSVNQFRLNPFDYDPELVNYCQNKGIVVTAYSPLNKGRQFSNDSLSKIASTHMKTKAQILLRWGIQHDFVVIPKSSNKDRLIENSQIFDFTLSSEEMEVLDNLS